MDERLNEAGGNGHLHAALTSSSARLGDASASAVFSILSLAESIDPMDPLSNDTHLVEC